MYILGIETSCDETGLAIYDSHTRHLQHVLHSQIEQHQKYGGVVPELAARDHICKITPLLYQLLDNCNITVKDLGLIAYTAGPGLIGALMVGANFAQALASSLHIPTVAINHLEAHILASKLEDPTLTFPFIALLVSGGHTQLILANALGDYKLLGETLDDAVGEAFDKVAKLLGLPYPGGPSVSKLAMEYVNKHGHNDQYKFTRPLCNTPKTNLDFSFSGLKTAVRNVISPPPLPGPLPHMMGEEGVGCDSHVAPADSHVAPVAYSFQQAVIDVLVKKTMRAIELTKVHQVVIAGGVASNVVLRQEMSKLLGKYKNSKLVIPRSEYCTDNGAMIAYAGYLHQGDATTDRICSLHARWPITA